MKFITHDCNELKDYLNYVVRKECVNLPVRRDRKCIYMPYGIQQIIQQQHCIDAAAKIGLLLLLSMFFKYPTNVVGFTRLSKCLNVKVLSRL